MTRVIGYFAQYCFGELKFSRLEAPIFDFNTASEAVLKKNGFILEKELPDHYNKNDQLIGAKMYIKQKHD